MSQDYVRVRVEHGTMETTINLFVDENADNDEIIGKVKRLTRNMRTLPMAYERFTIIERRPAED